MFLKKIDYTKVIVLAIFTALSVILSACGSGAQSKNKDASKNESASLSKRKASVSVKGSDTMVLIGQKWAVEYSKVNKDVTVQVTGGGSGVGIAALLNGTTDIANASRSIKEKEVKKLKAKGFDLVEFRTAMDGLSVYLHKGNKVDSLSFEQLSLIFRGQVSNWSKVGGSNRPIVAYGRENSSGTYSYFKNRVLKGKDFGDSIQSLPGTSAIVNAVSKDVNGIGYGGKAYSKAIKIAKISRETGRSASYPNDESVKSGDYPLSRYLFIYTTKQAMGKQPAIKEYIDWILSSDGQKIVKSVGYYAIK